VGRPQRNQRHRQRRLVQRTPTPPRRQRAVPGRRPCVSRLWNQDQSPASSRPGAVSGRTRARPPATTWTLADAGDDGVGTGIHVLIKRPHTVPQSMPQPRRPNRQFGATQDARQWRTRHGRLTGRRRVLRHTTESSSPDRRHRPSNSHARRSRTRTSPRSPRSPRQRPARPLRQRTRQRGPRAHNRRLRPHLRAHDGFRFRAAVRATPRGTLAAPVPAGLLGLGLAVAEVQPSCKLRGMIAEAWRLCVASICDRYVRYADLELSRRAGSAEP